MKYIYTLRSIPFKRILFLLPLFFLACSGTPTEEISQNSGQLSVQMAWTHNNESSRLTDSTVSDISVCEDYNIGTVSISIENDQGEIVGHNTWDCSAQKGSFSRIPNGSGYKVIVKAFVPGNGDKEKPDWMAIEEGIVVNDGKTTIKAHMKYTGSDNSPPQIMSHYPQSSEKNIPLNAHIDIQFNEMLRHSSITPSRITLKNGSVKVPIEILHTPKSDNITLKAQKTLEPNTTYSISIDGHISDCADNMNWVEDKVTKKKSIVNYKEFAFTTKTSVSPLNPPAGLSGKPGNETVWLNWDKVPNATGYNIYMSDSSSISTDPNGFIEVAPTQGTTFHWDGLINNTPYYFIVTSTKNNQESDATYMVEETPILIPFESDLVAYYDFLNGTADDLSVNANHGITYDVQAAPDRAGRAGRALYFNGKSSYIEIPQLNGLDPLKLTVIVIFKIFDYNNMYTIIDKGYEKRNFGLHIKENALAKAGYIHYSHSYYEESVLKTGYAKIYEFKIPFKKFGAATITLENKPTPKKQPYLVTSYIHTGKKSRQIRARKPVYDNGPLIIGANDAQVRSEFFKGVIDDVVIFKRPLNNKEISKLFQFLAPSFNLSNDVHGNESDPLLFSSPLSSEVSDDEETFDTDLLPDTDHFDESTKKHCPDDPYCE